jgi:hypothetical protein
MFCKKTCDDAERENENMFESVSDFHSENSECN